MNQRSVLPAPPLRREAAPASSSSSPGASAWRSRCPAAGGPAPRSSTSNSSSAAREQRSCSCPAPQRGLGDASGLQIPPSPLAPPPWGRRPVRAAKSNFGTRRWLRAAHAPLLHARHLRGSRGGNVPSFPGCAANRLLTSLPRRPGSLSGLSA